MSSLERSLGALLPVLIALAAGCRQDMYDQPRYEPLEASALFPDGASARQPPKGTVRRGDPRLDRGQDSGIDETGEILQVPVFQVDEGFLRRGRERFDIHCSPCHGRVGDGNGMIVLRGFKRPPSLHEERLRGQAMGYFVDVIRNGFGVMPSYAAQVAPPDRWAIAAYIGALQLSQHAPLSALPAADVARIRGIQ